VSIGKIRRRTRSIGNEFVLACDMRFASRNLRPSAANLISWLKKYCLHYSELKLNNRREIRDGVSADQRVSPVQLLSHCRHNCQAAGMRLSHSCYFCVVTIGKFEESHEGLDCKSLH
jgi:hypothetical protein